jgi:hypothetical protein
MGKRTKTRTSRPRSRQLTAAPAATDICHAGPALLHRIDPATGLTDADYLTLGGWPRAASTT